MPRRKPRNSLPKTGPKTPAQQHQPAPISAFLRTFKVTEEELEERRRKEKLPCPVEWIYDD